MFQGCKLLALKRMELYFELRVLFSFVEYRKFQATMQIVALAETVV
jgi:hypothetical protein